MAPWNFRAVETLVKLQRSSLRHLHLELQCSGFPPPPLHRHVNFDAGLDSLHFKIIDVGMSAIAASILCDISPKNIMVIGLDVTPELVLNVVEAKKIARLAEVLKTGRFEKLHRIHIRLEYASSNGGFEKAAQILRGMFPEKLLIMKSIPHAQSRRSPLRDATDDCRSL
ncbi:hypothetical protein BDZ94DRAFT_1309309 [Collybia nuda]|uniref:Uncharacterized protein n=1 Tax=Collybia nuda TaxID=64659 RepID=A0A9P5Y6V5_9AGAR|nr:hypothetical protein BDZ94DRAFT_1309309 [Collybia nuda]